MYISTALYVTLIKGGFFIEDLLLQQQGRNEVFRRSYRVEFTAFSIAPNVWKTALLQRYISPELQTSSVGWH